MNPPPGMGPYLDLVRSSVTSSPSLPHKPPLRAQKLPEQNLRPFELEEPPSAGALMLSHLQMEKWRPRVALSQSEVGSEGVPSENGSAPLVSSEDVAAPRGGPEQCAPTRCFRKSRRSCRGAGVGLQRPGLTL